MLRDLSRTWYNRTYNVQRMSRFTHHYHATHLHTRIYVYIRNAFERLPKELFKHEMLMPYEYNCVARPSTAHIRIQTIFWRAFHVTTTVIMMISKQNTIDLLEWKFIWLSYTYIQQNIV